MSAGIAVVVPVLDDTPALSALLARVDAFAAAPRDVIVVSGKPDSNLRALCRARGCTYVETLANRGAQLDRGARETDTEILWFLHADASPPPHAPVAIATAVAEGAESGCFRFRFRGARTWYKALLESLVSLRIRCGGMVYGDQGIFARRDAYLECGGFTHEPLFEEVALVKRLRARGTFSMLPVPLGVSTRRWERDGWCRRTLHNRRLATCHMLGVSAQRLAGAYRQLVGSRTGNGP